MSTKDLKVLIQVAKQARTTGVVVVDCDTFLSLVEQLDELRNVIHKTVWHMANLHFGKAEHLLRVAIATEEAQNEITNL